ncbi:hypothetical protein OH76DRAFT_1545593 [Lentinus brumalis]|uniref:F-box domain-containing protein n=1 Tax=Lentinus brumalis TaxID=2498619 RepID=A0A371DLM3_9APHY|nr:hypothetical protein OH76DRAFT_1545593 [Polyporus brumalis]
MNGACFSGYARLVRALSIKYTWLYRRQSFKTHHSVISTLCVLRPSLVLFPNLRTLDWPIMDLNGSYLLSILSLVGDKVTTLRIEPWDPRTSSEQTLQAVMGLIAFKFRYLRILEFISTEIIVSAAISAAVSSLVSGLHSLTEFTCLHIPVSPSSAMHLAELRKLQTLRVRFPDASTWCSSGSAFQPRSFAGLTNVLLATTMSTYISFSKAIALPHIQELVLEVVDDPAAQLISQFFTAIRRQCSPLALRNLKIRPRVFPVEAIAQLNAAVLRSADLRPLLDFSLMKYFDLAMYCRHAFDDAFILDVAKAWPHLKKFHLGHGNPYSHETLPSLTALAHLALYAPNLREVGLRFDAASWAKGPQTGCSGPPKHLYGDLQDRASTASNLRFMSVSRSPIACPEKVALFLARIFPTSQPHRLTLEGFGTEAESKGWEEVQRYLPMFTCIREDEQLRMEQERKKEDEDEDEEATEASPPSMEPSGIDADVGDPHVQ